MNISVDNFPTNSVSNYSGYRDQIQNGDLLLCSGSSRFSRMIQRATGSIWSHVGFVMRLDTIDRVMVLESVESQGVRTVPLRKYLEDYDNEGNSYPGGLVIARHAGLATATVKAAKWKQFGQFAVDLFGYPYDRDELAKISWRIMVKKGHLQTDREYICSEYVWECYKNLGIKIQPDERGFIAPADFARAKEVTLQAVLQELP